MTTQTDPTPETHLATERRSLARGKWGNLFMGAAGILAAWASGSQALMVDGLFSLIGFFSAIIAARVSTNAILGPDRLRPFGYAADESLFTMFRALSLMALVLFALLNAGLVITGYALGGPAPELQYGPILVYFVVIGLVCFGIAWSHRRAWKQTGKQSGVLRLEFQAALFDGLITLAAGIGLSIMPFLRDTKLGWMTPIGDSLVVVLLCLLVVGRYFQEFRQGLGELAGVTAKPATIATARRALRDLTTANGGTLVDLSLVKIGRNHDAVLYYDPGRAVTTAEVDQFTRDAEALLHGAIGQGYILVQITRHRRAWGPDAPNPITPQTGHTK